MFFTYQAFVVLFSPFDAINDYLGVLSWLITVVVSLHFHPLLLRSMIHLIVLSQVVQLIVLSWWTLMLVVFQLSVTILIIAYLIDLEVFVLQ
jgi:hypothetical protein